MGNENPHSTPPQKLDVSPWMEDGDVARLFDALNSVGEARFIGGAVRDALLGELHADLDMAATAEPARVMAALRAAGIRVVETGLAHGTVTAVLARGPVEITTLRKDVETDGRHAIVEFTDDWREDAARRDFTINALSADRNGNLYDYFGGARDLADGRVRFIGDEKTRIEEDYLRILRFFRFSARFATGAYDSDVLEAIRALAPGVARLSGERIQAEIVRLLGLPRAADGWGAMLESGVADHFLVQARDVDRLARLVEIEIAFGFNDPLRRLISLMPMLSDGEAEAVAFRLKLSARDRERLTLPGGDPARLEAVGRHDYARALYGVDRSDLTDMLLIEAASDPSRISQKDLSSLMAFAENWEAPEFPLNGRNLIDLGLKPGPIFGSLLREVERWWIEHGFRPTRQECFAELKRVWNERKGSSA